MHEGAEHLGAIWKDGTCASLQIGGCVLCLMQQHGVVRDFTERGKGVFPAILARPEINLQSFATRAIFDTFTATTDHAAGRAFAPSADCMMRSLSEFAFTSSIAMFSRAPSAVFVVRAVSQLSADQKKTASTVPTKVHDADFIGVYWGSASGQWTCPYDWQKAANILGRLCVLTCTRDG